MPQTSIAYAVGRVRAAVRKPLGDAQLERLLAASSYQEALQLLGEMGWQDTDQKDIDRLSTQILEETCDTFKNISSEPELTEAFLLRHDAQNLKTLIKARVLNTAPESLSECGTLKTDMLRHAVNEHDYKKLPPMFQTTMNELEKKIALTVDPMKIDVHIDQALYAEIGKRSKSFKSKAARQYFTAFVDFKNAVAYLRLFAINRAEKDFMNVKLPGGLVANPKWKNILEKPERLAGAFKGYPVPLVVALSSAQTDSSKIPSLEKKVDDYLLSLFRPYKYEPFAIEVLIGWLLAHEREAGAVRLIMAGKQNDFPEELIRERLREAYGR
ncbi:MAG: V-type ATPase subunit [Bacillota bacterium]|nr:V-type ATPase subunit [Bacillota bacterium]